MTNNDSVPEKVTYPALYKRARAKAKQKFSVWPSAYASAYMITQYEKMVRERGGKPYKGSKSLELHAIGVVSYIEEGNSIDAIDYLKNIDEWFKDEWTDYIVDDVTSGMIPKSVLSQIKNTNGMAYSDKQMAMVSSYTMIVSRYGTFEQSDDSNGCDYRDNTMNQNHAGKCCTECIFFRDTACAIVSGKIDPYGICRLWIISEESLTESEYADGSEEEDGATRSFSEFEQKRINGLQQIGEEDDSQIITYEEEIKSLVDIAEKNKLLDSDFVFSDERLFPIKSSSDVADALLNWSNYNGTKSFEEFKSGLIQFAKNKNYVDALPQSWAKQNEVSNNLYSIKSVKDDVYKGIGVVYGGQDLVGDTFLKTTVFGDERDFKGMPLYFDHAQDNLTDAIGTVIKSESDDTGVWFEFQLDKRNKYTNRVKDLLNSGALGLSTGALNHLVIRENGQIKRWIIGELSLTPTPAEPRTFVNNAKVVQQKTEKVAEPLSDITYILIK